MLPKVSGTLAGVKPGLLLVSGADFCDICLSVTRSSCCRMSSSCFIFLISSDLSWSCAYISC